MNALDYPKERLDIKLVVEADDMTTRLALDLMDLGTPFEIVIAPPAGPRTKPKALNAALPFVRAAMARPAALGRIAVRARECGGTCRRRARGA